MRKVPSFGKSVANVTKVKQMLARDRIDETTKGPVAVVVVIEVLVSSRVVLVD